MDRDSLAARLLATFVEELEQQVQLLNTELLALERAPDDAPHAAAVFRIVHTLKGAAHAAGVRQVETLCHALETRLAPLRGRGMTRDALTALFAAADTLSATAVSLRGGTPRPEPTPLGTPAQPAPTAAPAPKPAIEPPTAPTGPADLRVDPAKLEALQGLVSSTLAVADRMQARMDAVAVVADAQLSRALRDDTRTLANVGSRLSGAVRELRLRPVRDLTELLPRVVRDLAAGLHKDVELVVTGADVEADRAVLNALRDPILHLLRNAVDHGIEAPDVRERAGKPRQGTITVGASIAGEMLRIEVRDDGAGVDEDGVRRTLATRGRTAPDRASIGDALFETGLSSREHVTTLSGRGVGLDAVRTALTELGGSVDLDWTRGLGMRFTLSAPLTLAVQRALIVAVGEQRFAIPIATVDRVLRVGPDDARVLDDGVVLPISVAGLGREAGMSAAPVPVVSLARALGAPLVEKPLGARTPTVIVANGARRLALLVDALLEERELVLRPLERAGGAARRFGGAAVIGEGQLVLVVNVASLFGTATSRISGAALEPSEAMRRTRVLVADDSITTRALEESVLAAAGYDVLTAVDGADAWRIVQAGGVDLVVSDVEMPRMDGFELCERIKGSERHRATPVLLVTSLDRPEQRARGLEAGADAYLTKSSFDQDTFLDVIHQLVGER